MTDGVDLLRKFNSDNAALAELKRRVQDDVETTVELDDGSIRVTFHAFRVKDIHISGKAFDEFDDPDPNVRIQQISLYLTEILRAASLDYIQNFHEAVYVARQTQGL